MSDCGTYRYRLWRTWHRGGRVNFVMLNPSTADATLDDPTIRRCIRFARDWGYGELAVTNLFGLRSTDPRALKVHADPVGPDNDYVIETTAAMSDLIVFAWGVHGGARGHAVATMLRDRQPTCLGLTKDGSPRHPLYVPAATPAQPFFPSMANPTPAEPSDTASTNPLNTRSDGR